jgi:hypothetical protein
MKILLLILLLMTACEKPKEKQDDLKQKVDSGKKCGCETIKIKDNGKQ